jgi:hypothetical protein
VRTATAAAGCRLDARLPARSRTACGAPPIHQWQQEAFRIQGTGPHGGPRFCCCFCTAAPPLLAPGNCSGGRAGRGSAWAVQVVSCADTSPHAFECMEASCVRGLHDGLSSLRGTNKPFALPLIFFLAVGVPLVRWSSLVVERRVMLYTSSTTLCIGDLS